MSSISMIRTIRATPRSKLSIILSFLTIRQLAALNRKYGGCESPDDDLAIDLANAIAKALGSKEEQIRSACGGKFRNGGPEEDYLYGFLLMYGEEQGRHLASDFDKFVRGEPIE